MFLRGGSWKTAGSRVLPKLKSHRSLKSPDFPKTIKSSYSGLSVIILVFPFILYGYLLRDCCGIRVCKLVLTFRGRNTKICIMGCLDVWNLDLNREFYAVVRSPFPWAILTQASFLLNPFSAVLSQRGRAALIPPEREEVDLLWAVISPGARLSSSLLCKLFPASPACLSISPGSWKWKGRIPLLIQFMAVCSLKFSGAALTVYIQQKSALG